MSFFGVGQKGITLKELLENPNLQKPPQPKNDSNKEKGNVIADGFDPSSAFLGPNLWNTPDFQDDIFKLEYMDLDEFMSENGIPLSFDDSSNGSQHSQHSPQVIGSPVQEPVSHSPSTSSPLLAEFLSIPEIKSPSTPVSVQEETPASDGVKQVSGVAVQPAASSRSASSYSPLQPAASPGNAGSYSPLQPAASPGSASSYSPQHVEVDFDVPDTDLALASIPGQEGFDPKKRHFTEEELKPQPIVKKSRKVFVPNEMKDERYWSRRNKNNVAAKRSRDARRVKENQIALRASFLEKENNKLKDELDKMKKENAKLQSKIKAYETQKQLT